MVDKMMKSRLPPLTAEESVEVSIKLCRFLGESLRPDILLHAVLIFLEIARAYQRGMAKKGIGAARPRDVGIEMVELQKRVGLSSSAISRIVAELGEWGTRADPQGMGLVAAQPDPQDRRYKPVVLTHKGVSLIEKLAEALA